MNPAQRSAVIAFAWMTAAYCIHGAFFGTYLPLWLKQQGMTVGLISTLMALQPMMRIFVPYAWGALADRTHKRTQLLRWMAAMTLLFTLGLWWQSSLTGLVLILLGIYMHFSGVQPLTEAAVTQVLSQEGHLDTRLYGRVRLCGSIGFMTAVMWAGWWFENHGLGSFVTVVACSAGFMVLVAWRAPVLYSASATQAKTPIGPVLRQRAVRWFLAGSFFHVLSHMGIYTFFSLYLDSLGYSKTMIGLCWTVSVSVEIFWFFTQSRWLPMLPVRSWLLLAGLVMAARMVVTAEWAGVMWVLLIAQAFHAITYAAHHGASMTLVSRYFPGQLMGRGQALFFVCAYGVPGMLAGLLGGHFAEVWGLSSIYWLCAASALLAAACQVVASRGTALGNE